MARVLVVDDSRTVRAIISQQLSEAGHEVLEAADGKLGLALFIRSSPDLVISDVVMPEMDGFEILGAIRRAAPATPLILMSGGGRTLRVDDLLRSAKLLGAWQVLRKPFSGEELLHVVEGALSTGRRAAR
ncbi:MAG: response regulator [Gemmatimonadales bacterium]